MGAFVTSAAGFPVPGILYGTAWKKDDTARLVGLAIRMGFRGIDTACQPKHYDEAGVGAGIASCVGVGIARGDLYLQTKFTSVPGHDPARIPYDPNATLGQQVAQSFATSLRNLQTTYVDCLLIHSPLDTPEQTLEVWRAFELLIDAGTVRQAGISNCYELSALEDLYQRARTKPSVVQNRFYAGSRYDRGIRSFCLARKIVYQSFWTLTANPDALAHEIVTTLAAAHRRTPAQILFRYLTQVGVVPLSGTRSETHMREDLSIIDFELTPAERDAVGGLFAR